MDLITALNWRYATKKMSGETVEQELVNKIIEAAYLAPTSSGLQPIEIISISNKEMKEKILPIAYNQQQIIDCSHLLVFTSWDKYTHKRVDDIFNHMDKERGLPENNSFEYRESLKEKLDALSTEEQMNHTAKQAYISLGTAIAQAAMLKVDATPMEGFINADLDKLLDLTTKGLRSQVILSVGRRAKEGDWLQNLKKVRQPINNFLTEIK